jgi:hypothetical protein
LINSPRVPDSSTVYAALDGSPIAATAPPRSRRGEWVPPARFAENVGGAGSRRRHPAWRDALARACARRASSAICETAAAVVALERTSIAIRRRKGSWPAPRRAPGLVSNTRAPSVINRLTPSRQASTLGFVGLDRYVYLRPGRLVLVQYISVIRSGLAGSRYASHRIFDHERTPWGAA